MNYLCKFKKNGLHLYGLMVCLALLLLAERASAFEEEHRLSPGVTLALGIGAEVTYGNYGSNAEATVVTMPLLVAINPLPELDMTLELPLAYLSSRKTSGVVVTQSGGTGFRRRAPRSGGMTMPTSGTTTMAVSGDGTSSAAGLGDISLTAGYAIVQDSELTPRIRPMVYLKAPTGDKNNGLGTGTFEGGRGCRSQNGWVTCNCLVMRRISCRTAPAAIKGATTFPTAPGPVCRPLTGCLSHCMPKARRR